MEKNESANGSSANGNSSSSSDPLPSTLKGKRLLVVNTGWVSKRVVFQRLNKMGIDYVVLNKEINWAEKYVDEWILADTYNHEACLEAVEKYMQKKNIDGVLTFWEDDVQLTAKIVDKFGFKGINYKIASTCRNKFEFRKFCKENGLRTPAYRKINSFEDLEEIENHMQFPLVIKPVYGTHKAFVIKIEDRDELMKTVDFVKKNISVDVETALASGFEIMVEEYIDGDEVDVNVLVQNGKIKFWSITDNALTREPFFIETGSTTPSLLPEDEQEDLLQMTEEVLEKLGVKDANIHFEAKMTKDGPVPIECNLRMGGDEFYLCTKKAWGVDLIDYNCLIALGEYVKIDKPEEPKQYLMSASFLADKSGIIIELDVDPDLKDKRYLEDLEFEKQLGDAILVPPEGYEYLGWIVVSGDNANDASDNLKEALAMVDYRVAKFAPDSSFGKTERKDSLSMASMNKALILGAAKLEKIKRQGKDDAKDLRIGILSNLNVSRKDSKGMEFYETGLDITETLRANGYSKIQEFSMLDPQYTFRKLAAENVDLIINVCDSINDTTFLEPHVGAMLDILQIPYTGSNFFSIALSRDKIRMKKLLTYHDIPTPAWDYLYTVDDELSAELDFPMIVKPALLDGSIGISQKSVVSSQQELREQVAYVINELHSPALVEEYIQGDEYDVCIIGNQTDLKVLPLSRTMFDKLPENYWHIYSYEAKWEEDKVFNKYVKSQCPPKRISQTLEKLITEVAVDTYNILGCHDYAKVEVKLDENNNPYVLELNANPSLHRSGIITRAAKVAGMEYEELLGSIIKSAIDRYSTKQPYAHLV